MTDSGRIITVADSLQPTFFVIGADLLRINLKTGEVTGSVETASEAGRVFVETIRSMIGPSELVAKAKALVALLDDAEINHGSLIGKATMRGRDELRLELSKWSTK